MIDERYILSRLLNRMSIFAGQVLVVFYSYLGTKLLVIPIQIIVPQKTIGRYYVFINYCDYRVYMRHFVSSSCLQNLILSHKRLWVVTIKVSALGIKL
jgi:hypothetical protein